MIPIIVLARLGSTRFPRKHMQLLGGKLLIAGIIERAQEHSEAVVLATSQKSENNDLVDVAMEMAAGHVRGPDHDVWFRVLTAAQMFGYSRWIVWLGDCPFVDHRILESVISAMEDPEIDADYFVAQPPFNGIEGVMIQGWTWRGWVELGRDLAEKPEYVECPWQLRDDRKSHSAPVDWRDLAATPIKASIDYPLELAIANRVVAHIGHWPTEYDELISAYQDIKEL